MQGQYIMPRTILLTEDDKDVAKLTTTALQNAGYTVIWAPDGIKAVEILQNNRIDLIILDVMMPVFSGYWFCDVFKRNPDTKDIPVIFLSALSSEEDIKRGLELGASAYLTKPFKVKRLIDTVASFFE